MKDPRLAPEEIFRQNLGKLLAYAVVRMRCTRIQYHADGFTAVIYASTEGIDHAILLEALGEKWQGLNRRNAWGGHDGGIYPNKFRYVPEKPQS